jgi:hypothetical protein
MKEIIKNRRLRKGCPQYIFIGEDLLNEPELKIIAGENLGGEAYKEQNTVAPLIQPQSSTGRDRNAPWNDSWINSNFSEGRSEWRFIDQKCPPLEKPDDPCAPPIKTTRPCTLGSNSGLFSPYRLSAKRAASRSSNIQNLTFGQSWTGKRTWRETNEKSNDLQTYLENSGFGSLFPYQTPCVIEENTEDQLESITVVLHQGEIQGSSIVGVNDTFAPNTSLLIRTLGDQIWLKDEIKTGFQPWLEGEYDPYWTDEYAFKPIYDIKKKYVVNKEQELKGSTPWWDTQPQINENEVLWNENSLNVRVGFAIIGTNSGEISTFADLTS